MGEAMKVDYKQREKDHPSLRLASEASSRSWSAGRYLDAVGSVFNQRIKPKEDRRASLEAALVDLAGAKRRATRALRALDAEADPVRPAKRSLTGAKVYSILRKKGLERWVRSPGLWGTAGNGSGDVVVNEDDDHGDRVTVRTHDRHNDAVAAATAAGLIVSDNRPPSGRSHRDTGEFTATLGPRP
jgi:hypothetical protein